MTTGPIPLESLSTGLAALAVPLPADAPARLAAYVDLLLRWNRAFNLTAVTEPGEIVTRHLLDSLAIARFATGASLADLGSGAGLPGIPLAIAAPERRVTLIDANGKKARFLRAAVRELGLDNAIVVEGRVESVAGEFDTITSRAFSSLADMLAAGGHLLAPDGLWLAMKGRRPDDEIADMPDAFEVAGVTRLEVPGLGAERHVVAIRRANRQTVGPGDRSAIRP
ncbi:MAG: 16S rRNA (guanine(527)-N(7))-methyltransferase RsmG [Lysobacterales bacterium]